MEAIWIQKQSGESQRKSVVLSLDHMGVKVQEISLSTGQVLDFLNIPFSGLTLTPGGNNQDYIFLNSPILGTDTVYFENNRQNRNEWVIEPQAKKLLADVKGFKKKDHGLWAFLGVSIAVLVLILIYRAPLFGSMGYLVPFRLEQSLASAMFNPKLFPAQKVIVEHLRNETQKVSFPKEVWDHPFTIHISSEMIPNAYATLGGHVFVTKGLITILESFDELMGVMAHEMVHVQKRHVMQSFFQAFGVYALTSLLIGDLSGIAVVIADQGAPLLNLQYSRTLEKEADIQAIRLLAQNGRDPSGLETALKKINEKVKMIEQQAPGAEILAQLRKIEILSSHPDPEQRIRDIQDEIKALGLSSRETQEDQSYKNFKDQVLESF